jgi:glutamyl-tRNA synthetase
MTGTRDLIEMYALQNAIKYKGTPSVKAVMHKLMGMHHELRPDAKNILPIVEEVLAEIKKKGPDEWEDRLKCIAPVLLYNISKARQKENCKRKNPEDRLPDLRNPDTRVVLRFAPNPVGPPTLEDARGIIINSVYAKKFNGKFLLRFDDTDPRKEKPHLEAYDWYKEDCEWLGAKPDEVYIASKRLPYYYQVAEDLICKGDAYVCQCAQGTFKVYREKGISCRHRSQSIEQNLNLWNKMLNREFSEGEAVLRIKTNMSHKDPAIRDWPAARIINAFHPLTEDAYCVWPLLDFESAIEDHLLGVTHIIRSKDFNDSKSRQEYLYKHMNWKYPNVIHYDRLKINKLGSIGANKLRRAIDAGEFSGWDDPAIPTVKAIRRRGIRPEALRKYMISLGVGKQEDEKGQKDYKRRNIHLGIININMDAIFAENRKIILHEANRYFFVTDPIKLDIDGDVPVEANTKINPANKDSGSRRIPAGNRVFISYGDLYVKKQGDRVRLKDLCDIEIISKEPAKARFLGENQDVIEPIISWVPYNGIPVMIRKPGSFDKGICEAEITKEIDRVVRLERYGFVRIDQIGDPIIAYYTQY